MKNPLLFRLVVLVTTVMCALGVSAQEAYAVYTSDNAALSFYYDNDRSSRTGTTYDLNNGPVDPGWVTDFTNLNVKQVVFDSSFEAARPISTFYWFSGMRNLVTITGLEYLNTSEVTRMDDMFNRCYKLRSLNLEKFNISKVTDMSEMFRNCNALQTIYVGDGWRLSEMAQSSSHNMFKDCTSLVGGKGTAYDAAHVDGDYAQIDGGTDNPGYLSAGTMSYVCYTPENTTITFYYDNQRDSRPGRIYDLNVGINRVGWELDHTCQEVTNAVIDPSFADARPTTTYAWFYGMNKIDTIIGLEYLNTSEVTIMNWMFGHSNKLEHIDVSHFNTDKVTSMYAMFGDCEKLKTLDLSNWNTANVTDMDMMFSFCLELKTIYVGSGWNTDCVTQSEHMFANNFLLVGGQGTAWDASNPKDKTYAHIDGGTGNPGYFTDKFNPVAYAVFENTTLTFYYDFERNSRSGKVYELNTGSNFPAWDEDGITGIVNYAVFDPSFADARPTSTNGWFLGMQFLKSIKGLEYLNTSEVTNMGDMFNTCSALTSIDLSHFNTDKVTFMAGMFALCRSLKILDLSSFNTANVFTMRLMFYNCGELQTIYVSDGWSTASAIGNCYQMFQDCNSLVGGQGTTYDPNHTEEDYAHLDGGPDNPGYFSLNDVVEKPQVIWCEGNTTLYFINSETMYVAGDTYDGQTVTNVWSGYAVTATPDDDPDFNTTTRNYCTRVVFDESFAAVRPTSCYGWFHEFEHLTVIEGIENLNTSNVTDMAFMFTNCEKLTSLDLSNFNTAKVKQLFFMFYGCEKLQTIYVGDGWILSDMAQEISENVFNGCFSLVGGKGTTFDPAHVGAEYAHIDGGSDNPGYFSEKPASVRGDVDSDGHVDINDVTLLIDVVLGKNVEYNAKEADCNTATGDGTIDIDDVTALIARVLNGSWPWEEPQPANETFTVNGVSFTMIGVQGGTFTMGATTEQGHDAYDWEKPAHEVTLSSYSFGQTEVTQELWQAVMGINPSNFNGGSYGANVQRPVETVSWDDCQTFFSKLNQMTGRTFRMPTEAEWEFAARGGNQSQGYKYSGSNTVGDVAWYTSNSSSMTHPVATKSPNELGLYDMTGNVTEWCQDWYDRYSSEAQINPTGPASGSERVVRGGGWGTDARDCRLSVRGIFTPTLTNSRLGLRLAL